MSADVCGNCGQAVPPSDVDEVEAAIRTLRMRAEDGEPRAVRYAAAPQLREALRAALNTLGRAALRDIPDEGPDRDMRPGGAVSAVRLCRRCGLRPVQNNGQGSCDSCAQA